MNDAAVRAAGVPDWALARLRSHGTLLPVSHGVDRMRDHPWTWDARCQAALDATGPRAVLGRSTAARLHGFYRYRTRPEIEVLRPRGGDHRTAVGRIYESRWLPAEHVTTVDGFPATTAARTFFDLAGHPPGRMPVDHPAHAAHMRAVYNDALARRGLTFVLEAAVLVVMAKRGRSGTVLTRSILLEFPDDYVPTDSDSETLFLELVIAYELPRPEHQVVISGRFGFIGRVDFCWRGARLVVEVDSSWHDGPTDKRADQQRDQLLGDEGWTVKRYRFDAMVRQPAAIARELAVLLARQR